MRAQHAFRAAGPDESDTFQDLVRRHAKALCESNRIGQRSEAAREVVGAAISLGLADQGDDLGGIDLSLVDETLHGGNVVGAVHRKLVDANLHRAKSLSWRVASRILRLNEPFFAAKSLHRTAQHQPYLVEA
jgi:hypothetical protein